MCELLSPLFIVRLHVEECVLAVTLALLRKLLAKHADMCMAIAHIDTVQHNIGQMPRLALGTYSPRLENVETNTM